MRSRKTHRYRPIGVLAAIALLSGSVAGVIDPGGLPTAQAAPSIAQTYYLPFEAQEYIDVLRSIADDPACCSTSVVSAVSITSAADGNTVVYDHYEDGYEADPLNPVQGSTITLSLDAGQVWTQSSDVPVDPRGAGNFFDGRDKVVSTGAIAMTQAAYASDPGTVHAGAVQVLDLDKSGTAFEIPVGEDVNYNGVFDHVGVVIVGSAAGTTVQIDADANGSYETSVGLGEGETHVVDGGMALGASVIADEKVSVYVVTGDHAATYEGRFFELYPTSIWSDRVVSPVASVSTATAGQTRVFLYNPNAAGVTVDVTSSGGPLGSIAIAAGSQGTFLMPVDQGALFATQSGDPVYGMQVVTSEGTETSTYDWGFTLIPERAATPAVVVPYGPGSAGLTDNFSPVWVASFADTTLYVDLDGDPATGPLTDPAGQQYDFSCAVVAYQSVTLYADGTTSCYAPSELSAAGGDRDMTGARIYTIDDVDIVSAWGQRPGYTGGSPALDMGTTILPTPSLDMIKTAALVVDADSDGYADPGDVIEYTIEMTNNGIIDVGQVVMTDDTPEATTYLALSTALDGAGQPDDGGGYTVSPVDSDSPSGGLAIGTIAAGQTKTVTFRVTLDDPLPFGTTEIFNIAITNSETYGANTALVVVDAYPGLQIRKTADTPGPVGPGDSIMYTIEVFNGETATSTGIDLADALPAGLTYTGGTAAGDVDGTPLVVADPPDLIAGLDLDAGQLLTVTFEATVDGVLPGGLNQFVNEARTSSDQHPEQLTDSVTLAAMNPSVAVTKTPSAGAVPDPGGTVTFTVGLENTSGRDEDLDTLEDDVFGNLLDAGNPAVSNNTCPALAAATIPPAGTVSCSFDADLAGSFGDPDHVDTVTAGVSDIDGNTATGQGSATVSFGEPPPSVAVTKTPSTGSVDEPGGSVTYTVEIENTSVESLTIDSLDDDVFGDLLDPGNGAVLNNTCPITDGVSVASGGVVSCSFDADLAGSFGDPDHVNTVTAVAHDIDANPATDAASATVSFGDVVPAAAVTKTADPVSVPDGGGTVTFSVAVENLSVEPVTLDSLGDDVFGDLLDAGNGAVLNNTCPALAASSIGIGASASCAFDAVVPGSFGDPDHADVVTAEVSDDDGNTATAQDSATVSFGEPPPSIAVAKTPSTGSVDEPGGTITFTIEVENTSIEDLTLDSLDDDLFGDLLDPGNGAVSASDCADLSGATITAGSTVSCSFDGEVTGGFGDPDHVNTVTAIAADADTNPASGEDTATVAFDDVLPTVGVDKRTDATVVAEPGETVTFTVEVENASPEDVTVVSLDDDLYGDLLDPGNPAVLTNDCPSLDGVVLAEGETGMCAFEVEILGSVGDPDHENTVTLDATDDDGNTATAEDTVTLEFAPGTADIEGQVFEDLDGNGVLDAGEPGIPDVDIVVTDSAGTVTVTTAADGTWGVTVASGEVTITVDGVTVPEGWELTTSNDTQAIDAIADETTASDDIGYVSVGELTGLVFEDLDGDGVRDPGESGIEGVGVTVTDADGDQILTTAADGTWTTTVAPGTAAVAVDPDTVPDGLTLTTGNESQSVDVVAGGTASSEDVGYQPGPASVEGAVWLDLDDDGMWDGFEPPVPGVEVTVTDGAGTSVALVTGADGSYFADGLVPGDVTVAVGDDSLPSGLIGVVDPDAVIDGSTTVELAAGESRSGLDFAYLGTGGIGDTVWVDTDGDGVVDDDEDRIPGAVITLEWAGFDGVFGTDDDVAWPAAVSDGAGLYSFDHLPPGLYLVRVDSSSISGEYTIATLSEVGITLDEGMEYLAGDFGFVASDAALPYTGIPAQELLALSLLLMALGAGLLIAARRRPVGRPLAEAIRRIR